MHKKTASGKSMRVIFTNAREINGFVDKKRAMK